MRTWTAHKHVDADPAVVLDVLTDTDACRRWSPVPFDLDGDAGDRLAAGARMRVSGQLVGRRVGFDVEVHEAGDGRLALSAHGPVAFDVAYEARPADGGSEVSRLGLRPLRRRPVRPRWPSRPPPPCCTPARSASPSTASRASAAA